MLERGPQDGGVDEGVVVDLHDELGGGALARCQPLEHERRLHRQVGVGVQEVVLQDVAVPLVFRHDRVLRGKEGVRGGVFGTFLVGSRGVPSCHKTYYYTVDLILRELWPSPPSLSNQARQSLPERPARLRKVGAHESTRGISSTSIGFVTRGPFLELVPFLYILWWVVWSVPCIDYLCFLSLTFVPQDILI